MIAFFQTGNATKTAEISGLSRSTIERYKKDREFLLGVQRVGDGLEVSVTQHIIDHHVEAFATVAELMHSPNPNVALKAATWWGDKAVDMAIANRAQMPSTASVQLEALLENMADSVREAFDE